MVWYLTVEERKEKKNLTHTLVCVFVLSKLFYRNSPVSGHPLYLLSRLQKVQNTAAKLVFKLRKRRDRVKPLLQDLHWLAVQARIDYKMSPNLSQNYSLTHLLPISLTFSLCTPLPCSFVLLVQTHGYFVSSCSKQKPLANALFLTVLRSIGVLSLPTSVTFSPPMPSKVR